MKNSLDRIINRLGMANERINELQDMSVETSQTKMQKNKKMKF